MERNQIKKFFLFKNRCPGAKIDRAKINYYGGNIN